MYSAAVSTPCWKVSTDTPSHLVPSFDHLVTQWMSVLISSLGSVRNSSHVHRLGSSTSPTIEKSHWSRRVRGVGPAERTGKPSTRYWPGGSCVPCSVGRRRPLKPREMNPSLIAVLPPCLLQTQQRTLAQRRAECSSLTNKTPVKERHEECLQIEEL